MTLFPDFYVTSALVKDPKITMTRILSVATAGVCTEQLADIDHRRFRGVDYIELQHLLNANTLDYSSHTGTHAILKISKLHDLHHLHKDYCTWTLYLRIHS